MKRKKGTLRINAARAKTRLITGLWKEKDIVYNASSEDEQFYRRVAGYLDEGLSPLSQVLDQTYMANLDDAARQRYVLTMSGLVQKSIERYNKVC